MLDFHFFVHIMESMMHCNKHSGMIGVPLQKWGTENRKPFIA